MPDKSPQRLPHNREQQKTRIRRPKKWKVVMLNDDYTTMEFVIDILVSIFDKGSQEAFFIMLAVHNDGAGVAGVYPRDIAETKVEEVHRRARNAGFPLSCTLEPEDEDDTAE